MKKLTPILLYVLGWQLVACNVHPSFSANRDEAAAEVDRELVQVGKRNFWEINAAMAMVTGVDLQAHLRVTASASNIADKNIEEGIRARPAVNETNDSSPSMRRIIGAWQDVSGMMSRKNDINNCDPATQVGVFRLASAYCDRLVNDAAAWKNFVDKNFSGAKLSDLNQTQIATTLLEKLQTGSSLNQEQQEEAVATIVGYMNDNGGKSVSQETVFDICTMILSSAGTLVN